MESQSKLDQGATHRLLWIAHTLRAKALIKKFAKALTRMLYQTLTKMFAKDLPRMLYRTLTKMFAKDLTRMLYQTPTRMFA